MFLEKLRIHLVHAAEIVGFSKIDLTLNYVGHGSSDTLQDALDIVQHKTRFVADITQLDFICLRINWTLPGDVYEIAGAGPRGNRVREAQPLQSDSISQSSDVFLLRGWRLTLFAVLLFRVVRFGVGSFFSGSAGG